MKEICLRNRGLERELDARNIEWSYDEESECYRVVLYGIPAEFLGADIPFDIRERILKVSKVLKRQRF